MRLLMATVAGLLLSTFLPAQNKARLDSLLSGMSTARADSNKVFLLLAIADEYEISDLRKARSYIDRALSLSQEINFPSGIMKAYRHYAYIYSYQSRFDSSIYVNRKVMEIARQQKDSFNIGAACFNIGVAHRFRHDLDSALQYTLEAARLLDGKGYGSIEGTLNDGLQSLYMSLAQYDKAVEYGEKAVALSKQHRNMENLATALNNLGLSYVELDRVNDAKRVYEEGLTIARRISYLPVEAMLLNNLSDILLREGHFEEAGANALKVLEINRQQPDSGTIMNANTILANHYLYKREHVKAMQLANEVLAYANQQSFDDGRINAYNILARNAFAMGEIAKGMQYQFLEHKVEEAVFNESVKQREAAWRVRLETGKKDAQIQLQLAQMYRKDTWNYVLMGSVVTILLLSLLGYRNYLNRQKLQQQRINELETEKQLAATEAVLKGEEQERSRLAKDLHDGLGGMLSGIKYTLNDMKGNLIMTRENAQAFERSMDMLDSSIREMRRVAHNMMPEALLKFGLDAAVADCCNDMNKSGVLHVSYQSIGLDAVDMDETKDVAIYRIIQELLNNAIKHAAAKNVLVQLSYTNDQLVLAVEDDGKGFDPSILKHVSGIGWRNIQNRVEFLKGKWDVASRIGNGTSIYIEMPA